MKRAVVLVAFACLFVAGCFQPFAKEPEFHLYVLAGQSNMAGRGKVQAEDNEPHPRVFMLDKDGQWQPAVDPLHFDKPGAGVGPGLAFGKAMAQSKPNVKIGLIPCAAGGSPIAAWAPGGYHNQTKSHPYDDAIRRAKIAMQDGQIKGILWHQGESDSKRGLVESYQGSLETVIANFRRDLGDPDPDLPFVVGTLGDFVVAQEPNAGVVNGIFKRLPQTVPNTACADAAGLTCKSDNIHFNTESARVLGRRYAEQMLKLER